jgi:hypothetical protein
MINQQLIVKDPEGGGRAVIRGARRTKQTIKILGHNGRNNSKLGPTEQEGGVLTVARREAAIAEEWVPRTERERLANT